MARTRRSFKVPRFRSEAAEARFWDTHDSTAFLGEFKPVTVRFPKPRK